MRAVADIRGGGEGGGHRAHRQVDQLASACRDRPRHRERAAKAGQRIGDGVGAEHRLAVARAVARAVAGPADKPAGHGRVVPEGDPVRFRPAVPGDAEPDLAVPVRDRLRSEPERSQRTRPGRLDHHVRGRKQRRQRRPPGFGPEIDDHAAVPRVQPIEEPPVTGPAPIRPVRALDLDDLRAGQPE
jgi:hypothetical protein